MTLYFILIISTLLLKRVDIVKFLLVSMMMRPVYKIINVTIIKGK